MTGGFHSPPDVPWGSESKAASQVPCSARDIDIARRTAEDALAEYAILAFGWNAPDDEHTRRSIRVMVERVITAYDNGSLRG